MQIDPIQQRAADPAEIFFHLHRVAFARPAGVAEVAARAGVHGGDEDEARREERRVDRPADRHLAFFEGLAEAFETAAVELGQLVKEEDAVVGETDLARRRRRSAADHAGVGDGVVRAAERAGGEEGFASGEGGEGRLEGVGGGGGDGAFEVGVVPGEGGLVQLAAVFGDVGEDPGDGVGWNVELEVVERLEDGGPGFAMDPIAEDMFLVRPTAPGIAYRHLFRFERDTAGHVVRAVVTMERLKQVPLLRVEA